MDTADESKQKESRNTRHKLNKSEIADSSTRICNENDEMRMNVGNSDTEDNTVEEWDCHNYIPNKSIKFQITFVTLQILIFTLQGVEFNSDHSQVSIHPNNIITKTGITTDQLTIFILKYPISL